MGSNEGVRLSGSGMLAMILDAGNTVALLPSVSCSDQHPVTLTVCLSGSRIFQSRGFLSGADIRLLPRLGRVMFLPDSGKRFGFGMDIGGGGLRNGEPFLS